MVPCAWNKPRDAGLRQGRVGMLVRVCKVGVPRVTCGVFSFLFFFWNIIVVLYSCSFCAGLFLGAEGVSLIYNISLLARLRVVCCGDEGWWDLYL